MNTMLIMGIHARVASYRNSKVAPAIAIRLIVMVMQIARRIIISRRSSEYLPFISF